MDLPKGIARLLEEMAAQIAVAAAEFETKVTTVQAGTTLDSDPADLVVTLMRYRDLVGDVPPEIEKVIEVIGGLVLSRGRPCDADVESLRAGQAEDDEIAVHMEMHAQGRCPRRNAIDKYVYARRVVDRRG